MSIKSLPDSLTTTTSTTVDIQFICTKRTQIDTQTTKHKQKCLLPAHIQTSEYHYHSNLALNIYNYDTFTQMN